MIVEGQIHGGVAQGIANALYEEVVFYDDAGNILTGLARGLSRADDGAESRGWKSIIWKP